MSKYLLALIVLLIAAPAWSAERPEVAALNQRLRGQLAGLARAHDYDPLAA